MGVVYYHLICILQETLNLRSFKTVGPIFIIFSMVFMFKVDIERLSFWSQIEELIATITPLEKL